MSFGVPSPGHQLIMFAGGGVQGLHLPALPALKILNISVAPRTRLKVSTSSMRPLNAAELPSLNIPMVVGIELSMGIPPASPPVADAGTNRPLRYRLNL